MTKISAGDQDLILLSSSSEDEEDGEDGGHGAKGGGDDDSVDASKILPPAMLDAAREAVVAHMAKLSPRNKVKESDDDDDDEIQVEYENVKRVRTHTVPLVLDRKLHGEVMSALRTHGGIRGAAGGSVRIGTNLLRDAKALAGLNLSLNIQNGSGGEKEERQNVFLDGDSQASKENLQRTSPAPPEGSRRATTTTESRRLLGSLQQNKSERRDGARMEKMSGEGHFTTTDKSGSAAATATAEEVEGDAPSSPVGRSDRKDSSMSGQLPVRRPKGQDGVLSSAGQRVEAADQFDSSSSNSNNNNSGGTAESSRKRKMDEGDYSEDEILLLSSPSPSPPPPPPPPRKRQVAKRSKPRLLPHLDAANLHQQRQFLRDLDVRLIGHTSFVAVSAFRKMFSDFSVDLNSISRALSSAERDLTRHLRFEGWGVSHVSLHVAREILRARCRQPELVFLCLSQLAATGGPTVIAEDFDPDAGGDDEGKGSPGDSGSFLSKLGLCSRVQAGEKTSGDRAEEDTGGSTVSLRPSKPTTTPAAGKPAEPGDDLLPEVRVVLPRLDASSAIASSGRLTPLFRTARGPARSAVLSSSVSRHKQTAAMEKKGISLPHGWHIHTLRPPPMSKYKYVSPDGKTFSSLHRAVEYSKSQASVQTGSNVGKFAQADLGRKGGRTLEEIAASKKKACRKFPSNAAVKPPGPSRVSKARKRRRKKKVVHHLLHGPPRPTLPGTFSLGGLRVRHGGEGWFSSKISLLRCMATPLNKSQLALGTKESKAPQHAFGTKSKARATVRFFCGGEAEIRDLGDWSYEKFRAESALAEERARRKAAPPEVETTREVAQRIQYMTVGRASQSWEWRRRFRLPPGRVAARVTPTGGGGRPHFLSSTGAVVRERDAYAHAAGDDEFSEEEIRKLFLTVH